jgi:hypothetical protein
MNICPLCNGLRTISFYCCECGHLLADEGKVTDYFDDYSPYMEIDLMKQVDGYPSTRSRHQCVHLFHCYYCGKDEIKFINE